MPNGGTEEDAELPGFPPVEPEDEEEEVVVTKPDISPLVNKINRRFAWRCLLAGQGRRS